MRGIERFTNRSLPVGRRTETGGSIVTIRRLFLWRG
jgi:hypothetical protein